MKTLQRSNWSAAAAATLYGIEHWGKGIFSVSDQGEIEVTASFPKSDVRVSLTDIVQAAHDRDYKLPLLLRIENLLETKVAELNTAFQHAIDGSGYQNRYSGVFPVKVNQQCTVIEKIAQIGEAFSHGFEAGSKAELLLCLAHLNSTGLLICNGHKDREYVDLGLWANKLGHRCFFVIESATELPLILERSQALGIKPLIGLRIKISSKVGGLWTETTGDRSSFGLTTAQLIETVDQLKKTATIDCLQLLHCHFGSQIPDLTEIASAVKEASRFYADLAAEGVPLRYLDLGGGLAVDYIGNQALAGHSRNYDVDDYCRCIVETIRDTLTPAGVAHPVIVTESGRATVAHTSVLLFNILNVTQFEPLTLPSRLPEEYHPLTQRQYTLLQEATDIDLSAGYAEAMANRDKIRQLFRNGSVSLRERANAENLFLAIAQTLKKRLEQCDTIPVTLTRLKNDLADIYYGNFSVFQSLPDSWAIEQVFPLAPIHRLNEYPQRQATISDLTCDCDGKLDHFVLADGISGTLPLHPLIPGKEYILGAFLMGAYQETLGDLHNLFGDTNVISISINEGGGFDISHEQAGDTIAEVLNMLEYNSDHFFNQFRTKIEHAVKKQKITVQERQRILSKVTALLNGQTYINEDEK